MWCTPVPSRTKCKRDWDRAHRPTASVAARHQYAPCENPTKVDPRCTSINASRARTSCAQSKRAASMCIARACVRPHSPSQVTLAMIIPAVECRPGLTEREWDTVRLQATPQVAAAAQPKPLHPGVSSHASPHLLAPPLVRAPVASFRTCWPTLTP